MAILFTFLFGIANFALHKAVLESGHPLLAQLPQVFYLWNGRFSLVLEFVMLLGVMLCVHNGAAGWAWAYGGFTLMNGFSAWAILSGRV